MKLTQSWRWYGPNDPVSLQDVKQAGASHIVTALHHVPHGAVWPIGEIEERKKIIEAAGLTWTVVESVPVHEAIKTRNERAERYIANYRKTIENLAACGIHTVCYNFMPVLDWTRTQLDLVLEDGSKALYFDWIDLAIFDLYVLKRQGAATDYSEEVLRQAKEKYQQKSEEEIAQLSKVVLMGIPSEGHVTVEDLTSSIAIYESIGREGLRENLRYFLSAIADVCEHNGVNMTIHPDDPPYPILGLPRIASGKEDFLAIIEGVDKPFNGICFCTGSLGAGMENDVVDILEAVKHRVYFAHLRNVTKDSIGRFYEADHLGGDVNMYAVMKVLCEENAKRDAPIPFRPDHGHEMLDDLHKVSYPGYSAIGRLRGLAELRGLELGITGDYSF